MTKEELTTTILNLKLPVELEKIILDMIETAEEVNPVLLNTIADILDNQAAYNEQMAQSYQDIQTVNDLTNKELEVLDTEEYAESLEAQNQVQDALIKSLGGEPDPESGSVTASTETATQTQAPSAEAIKDSEAISPMQTNSSDSTKDSDAVDNTGNDTSSDVAPKPTFVPAAPNDNNPAESSDPTAQPISAVLTEGDEQSRQDSIAELKDQLAQMGTPSATPSTTT